jgi:hypothetical protein
MNEASTIPFKPTDPHGGTRVEIRPDSQSRLSVQFNFVKINIAFSALVLVGSSND